MRPFSHHQNKCTFLNIPIKLNTNRRHSMNTTVDTLTSYIMSIASKKAMLILNNANRINLYNSYCLYMCSSRSVYH